MSEADDYDWGDSALWGAHCKYCGDGGLAWVRTVRGWRLFDEEGNLHHCPDIITMRRNGEILD